MQSECIRTSMKTRWAICLIGVVWADAILPRWGCRGNEGGGFNKEVRMIEFRRFQLYLNKQWDVICRCHQLQMLVCYHHHQWFIYETVSITWFNEVCFMWPSRQAIEILAGLWPGKASRPRKERKYSLQHSARKSCLIP